ncbi:MAG: hypothetical protein KDC80_30410 [Saprospiraceae bacterium]|nr:hypothetical protein [Saprospiraceae bacterium]
MPLTERDLELIEKHLRDQLQENEKILFREKMQHPAFQEELQFRQKLKKAAMHSGREQLHRKFEEWDKVEPKGNQPRFTRSWLNRAAAILLIFASATVIFWVLNINTPSKLYREFYEPYANLLDPLQKGSSTQSASISQLYEQKRYQAVLERSPQDSLQLFYFGLTKLELKETSDAIEILEQIRKAPENRFSQAASWYLALAYLQDGNKEASKTVLNNISVQSDHSFQDAAAELLSKL